MEKTSFILLISGIAFILIAFAILASSTDVALLRSQAFIPASVTILEQTELQPLDADIEPREITPEEHVQGYVSGEVLIKLRGDEDISLLRLDQDEDVPAIVAMLEDLEEVEFAEPNYIVYLASGPLEGINDSHINLQYAIHNYGQSISGSSGTAGADINASEAWPYAEGEGVVVAVVDTGVAYDHPDLANNMWDGSNCKSPTGSSLGGCIHGYDTFANTKDPYPGTSGQVSFHQHGTFIAGIIAAEKNNETGIVGVAPEAKIMAIRASGTALSTTALINGIHFARHNGADIINASWVSLGSSFRSAISSYPGLFVAAAGNWSNDHDNGFNLYPCDYNDLPNVICVNATTKHDSLASFSDWGASYVHVGAPGEDVYSTTYNFTSNKNIYAYGNGTSYAAPQVVGLAALLMSYNPDLTVAEVKDIILSTGDPIPALDGKTITGKRINAGAALASIAENTTPINISPPDNVSNVSVTPTLTASNFFDPEGREHTDTEWRIATNDAFSNIIWSRQAEEAETVTEVSPALEYNTLYYWQVRYQAEGEWSDWSEATSFTTLNQYTLTYTAGEGGTIEGEAIQTILHGEDGSQVTAVPDEGYSFQQWSDGIASNPRTDTNVQENISVQAQFAQAPAEYALTYTAGEGGAIEGQATQTVAQGEDGSQVTAVPNEGYSFQQWSDGVTTSSRTDTNIQGNLSVEAQFAINQYTLTYTAGEGGFINGQIVQTVPHGSDGSLVVVMVHEGYSFNQWSDGVTDNPRTDTNVQEDITVEAQFTATATPTPTITPTPTPTPTTTVTPTPTPTPTPAPPLQQGVIPFINSMFREVYGRNPSVDEWRYWAQRSLNDKPDRAEILGAMQWHRIVNGRSPILLAGISTPPPSQQQPPSPVPPDTDTVSAINRLFRSVFNRNPTVAAWHFWANRVVSGEKATIPELLGAMQWQRLFGGR